MKTIDVSTKKFPNTVAMVDDEDYESLARFKWSASKPHNVIYAIRPELINGVKTTVRMHRQIMQSKYDIDHKDSNGLNNNQRSNLRPCTNTENQHNRILVYGSSKFKGVSWHKHMKLWRATIVIDKKQKTLGYFHSELEAAFAYDAAAIKHFKEFARPNVYG